jgi:tRNA-splicing endonuclease subunit Sen2
MTTTTPAPNKRGGRRSEHNQTYAHPLPIVFEDLYPNSRINSTLGLLGLSLTRVINPHCEGVFDPATRSVWVTNAKDSTILWRRGFFGKGDLSRSEPSWLARQKQMLRLGGKGSFARFFRDRMIILDPQR